MPITHAKVSTVADGSTTDHVRPSDWNASHTITNSTNASTLPYIRTELVITQTSPRTGSTVLTALPIFDGSTGLNGALTVGPDVTYGFETGFNISAGTTVSRIYTFGFGGTATLTRQKWTAFSVINTASSVPKAPVITVSGAAGPITAASTFVTMGAYITGKLVVGTSGTLIPQITRSAGTANLVTDADSYFRIWTIGDGDTRYIGPWS
jgi:hypothetical protein